MFLKLNQHFKCIFVFALLANPLSIFAQSAGTVIFKSGDAIIIHADKTTSSITKNTAINAGDTIDTRNGRVQLSLMDGGKVSLQPNTIYKINRYEFSGQEDGSEYAFTELVKGGLRTITGVIGHKNRDRYQLKTPVATIGIRGTEFSVVYNNTKLLMTTNHGSVDVCNAGGCLNAITGQTITTLDTNSAPQYTHEVAKVTSAPPSTYKPVFVQAEKLDEERISQVVKESVVAAETAPNSVSVGLLQNEAVMAASESTETNIVTTGSATTVITTVTTVDNSGPTPVIVTTPVATETMTLGDVSNTTSNTDMLVSGVSKESNRTYLNYALNDGDFEANANGNLYNYETNDNELKITKGSYTDTYSDAYVEMGSAKGKVDDTNVDILSYIKGDFTTASGLTNLANLSTPFVYNVIASTSPVVTNNAGKVINIGSSNSVTGSMGVNFATLAYSYNLIVPVSILDFNLTGSGSLTAGSPTFADNGSITTNLGNLGCVTGCVGILKDSNGNTATVSGALFGSEAQRAGLQYGIGTAPAAITGSVLLAR